MRSEPKRVVVVINDDATQRATLASFLESASYSVRAFASAEAALANLTEAPPDLIVTDLYMPGLDGWRLCRLLRSAEYAALNRVPILVVSATFAGEEPERITASLGANAFLAMPADRERFLELARDLVAGEPPQAGARVLVVEDDRQLATMLSGAFGARGFQVSLAHTGQEARCRVREDHPHTVILDYHLPDMEGDLLITEFQAMPAAMAVVVITGDVNPEIALKVLTLGARAYARKPFDPDYLIRLCTSARWERSLLRVESLLEQRTRELGESEEHCRIMADFAPNMMFLLDEQARIQRLNRAALQFNGWKLDAAPGAGPGDVLACVHASNHRCGSGSDDAYERCAIRRLWQGTLQSGAPCRNAEIRCQVGRNPQRPREVILMASTARVEVSGRPMVLLCLEDISERRLLEDQLRHAQKMEAVGQLAGGVAHDFNNILAASLLQLGLLQEGAHLTPDVRSALEDLEQGAKRAAGLTQQLLMFSRRHVMCVQPLELNALMADLLKMLRRLLSEGIDLVFQAENSPVWIEADAKLIEQAVTTLCVNARDAMPEGGRLTLCVQSVEISGTDARANAEARPGKFACLSVADTGRGMDETTIGRVFEPFFSTKRSGKGTGLGLATTYGIVKQHEGWIEVESKVGSGSVFRLFLPVLRDSRLTASPPPTPALQKGSETILVVEDEAAVRNSVVACLKRLGYHVLEASNGQEALERWSQSQGNIALLLTDLMMPGGMTGTDLADRLRQTKPDLKAIVSTGYWIEKSDGVAAEENGITYLAKPYTIETLADVVRRCVEREPRRGSN